jgi:transglutaminase-like putative cysteine protease
MPTTVALHHRTTYQYGGPVAVGPHIVRLRPAPFTRAVIRAYTLAVSPEPHSLRWFQDAPGNVVARVLFREPTDTLAFTVALQAELGEVNPFDFVLDPAAVTWPFLYPTPLALELVAYRGVEPIRPWLAALLTDISLKTQPSVELLVSLNSLLFDKIKYITRMEPGVLTPEETVSCGSGSCRDVAWLLVTVARSLGFAARFVSGYLIQLVDADAPTPGLESDSVDLHAWAEIYLPGAGWLGFDATSGLITGAGHIPLAGSAHHESAAPVSGTVGLSPTAHFDIETTVTRLPA